MPNYDFLCEKCGAEFELFRHINDAGEVACPKCGGNAKKIPSLVGFAIHNTLQNQKRVDGNARDDELERKLKQRFNLRGIDRLHGTMQDTYNDAMAQEGLIKDQMAAQQEAQAKQTEAKTREWKKGALKRTPQRAKEMKERKAKEAFEKRKIRLSTT